MTRYAKGDMVRIKTGPFAAYTGRVEEVNEEKATARIRINLKVVPFTDSHVMELPLRALEKIPFSGRREAE